MLRNYECGSRGNHSCVKLLDFVLGVTVLLSITSCAKFFGCGCGHAILKKCHFGRGCRGYVGRLETFSCSKCQSKGKDERGNFNKFHIISPFPREIVETESSMDSVRHCFVLVENSMFWVEKAEDRKSGKVESCSILKVSHSLFPTCSDLFKHKFYFLQCTTYTSLLLPTLCFRQSELLSV